MKTAEKQYVGVDCHKETIACYINGEFKEFKTDFKGFTKALEWVKNISSNYVWALEGAYSHGIMFAKFLLESGCEVYEFNSLVTAKGRKALSIAGSKNDMGDAKVISLFAKEIKMQKVSLITAVLKRLITSRKLIVKQRVEVMNSIKDYCCKEGIKLPFTSLKTEKAAKYLINCDNFNLKLLGNNLKIQTETIKTLEKEIEKHTPENVKKLTELTGIDTLTASILYTETKGKKMTKEQFASYCGVSPVENSSGQTKNFRNNKRGNRTLNSLLYSISIKQSIFDKIGSEYYHKKLSEGKTKRHSRKCLARQLCNQIWKILFKD